VIPDRVEYPTVAAIDAEHAIAAGLDWSSIPPVFGYNRVTAKPVNSQMTLRQGIM
jgi:uncharacterized membrane protein